MSYLKQARDPRRRNTAIIGVIIVHAALGYALVTGLSYEFIEHFRERIPIIEFKDPPKPPPPEKDPVKRETPKEAQMVAPLPPIDLTGPARTEIKPFDPIAIPDPIVIPLPPSGSDLGPPKRPPGLAPKRVSPRNDPERWVLTEDYPSRPLRERIEGVTGFRVVVGSDGRVDACEITRTSGNAELDAAACRNVTRRARFEPATDGNGAKVMGSFSSTVRWQIPR